ncbi:MULTISPECIES: L,D-transpeptidase [Streptacidiphilus]|uniref:L,D-transpeptidase n=1 Tax=Streptacidiphilus cavernicola TaxID=3342716 RepID=A0ABV6UGJ9_9ACTN|nr:L,D-transpeptidase [Streptacidiphilus jeojiense]
MLEGRVQEGGVQPTRRVRRAGGRLAGLRRAVVLLAVAGMAAAGIVTGGIVAGGGARAQAAAGPNASGRCPTTQGRIACVDLTHQRMWVQVGSRVVFGPVPVRTGRRGHVTRTGLWHVYWRDAHHRSSLYGGVAMPYSQFFSGGEAFHAVQEAMSTPPGSHGCVNLSNRDARALWGVLRLHDPVEVFGRKPGT